MGQKLTQAFASAVHSLDVASFAVLVFSQVPHEGPEIIQ